VQRVPAQAIAIPRDEIGVGTGVAGLHTAHQSGVARPHVSYTHARLPGVTSLSGSGSGDAAPRSRGIYHEGDLQVRCQGGLMSRRATLAGCLAVALSAAGCYQDDTTANSPQGLRPRITVLLTDAPFPYDSLGSVNVYVVRIEANAEEDTSETGNWVLVTEPGKSFDLLALQQGATALLGAGELPAGQYHSIRMTIDTNRSSIIWNSAGEAPVNWHAQSALYTFVDYPASGSAQGDIVVDFDLGQSFQYNYYGKNEFDFTPHLRAINSAAAGAIAGTVTQSSAGTTGPVRNAQVSVFVPYPGQPDSAWYLEATGRSDPAGHYKVAFLRPGSYVVRIEEPFLPNLDPVVTPNVHVAAGDTTPLSVLLPNAGSGGAAYVRISGPTSVGVGGTITLFAAVGDANGNPVLNPSVSWTSSDETTASVTGVGDTASVIGRKQGIATIMATSGGLSDSHTVQVAGSAAPVASVTVAPARADLAVGDSLAFRAELRDADGTLLLDRPVSWINADNSATIQLYSYGTTGIVWARAAGTAILRATSEGKTGQATITVH